MNQKTTFPFLDCIGKASGIGITRVLKKLILNNALESGINITREIIILINVKNSLNCQI